MTVIIPIGLLISPLSDEELIQKISQKENEKIIINSRDGKFGVTKQGIHNYIKIQRPHLIRKFPELFV
jgi:hypothetical protein